MTNNDHSSNSPEEKTPKKTTPCPGCGGSGQTAFFGGESRFMFTYEDCPDCCGTGILLDAPDEPATSNDHSSKAQDAPKDSTD